MKPLPTPYVPGKTEFERFDNAMRQVLTVSKEELLRREGRESISRQLNAAASLRKVASEQREMADLMRRKKRGRKK
jgi:hypothetical protein